MRRWSQAVSALPALARNENLRRVELAWAASIAAEWTHFVALGVFAYTTGGASAVATAGGCSEAIGLSSYQSTLPRPVLTSWQTTL